ncbi:ABC transporter glutamine-binding protein GlnH precursor [Clostridium puniceum]|uniref:ABC transporter glutamine-binding protein GlnH n=2 Tax=Clostridium puniceum TaxID=29367 RepID=A0A1S8T4T9_9CLOT|nr:ABC transporter glutamine-binding protein GlnH precursor [Clostridium puniceum]
MVVVPFPNLLQQLNNDDSIDIVADGMYITDERKKEALFTNIWYKESEAVIVPKISKIVFQEDLKNAIVGAQKGTEFLDLAEKLKTEGLVKDIIIFENQPELLLAITTGKVDAGILDSIVATYLISHDNNLYLKILSPYEPKALGNIAGAVRKNDVSLANAINQQINEMKQDKTIFNILQKYGLNIDYFVSIKES